ncbi:MAG TPA: DUF4232 domain-containing protein, partial [Acidimicrobiia bacterium]|nr:DUF4232 domain-containing protein [Acidimicrobiia bacterium]
RSRRGRRWLPALLTLGLLLAACSSSPSAAPKHGHHATTTTKPKNKTPRSTTSTTLGPPKQLGPCTVADLSAQEIAFSTNGPGTATTEVLVTNTTANGICTLTGYPSLQLIDGSGNNLPTTLEKGGSGIPASLTVQNVTLDPRTGQATFMLEWPNMPSGSQSCPLAPKMKLGVSGFAKTLTMPAEINACGGVIESSPFQPGVLQLP